VRRSIGESVGLRSSAFAAAAGAAVFLVCCLVVRGGLLDPAPYGDIHLYRDYAHRMAAGEWPYRNFFDEYPPLAQPLFYVVSLLPGTYAPGFKWTMALFGAGSIMLLVAALHSLRASRLRVAAAVAVAAVAPLVVGPIFLNAYDLWPAFLTAAALLAFVRRRERAAYVLLALAVAAKVYPLAVLPIALIATWDRGGRDGVRRAVAWFVGALVLVHVPVAIAGPGGLRFSYWVQLKRGLEVESLGGSVLLALERLGLMTLRVGTESPGSTDVLGGLAKAVGTLTSLAEVTAIVLVAWLYWRRRRRPVVAVAAAVLGVVAFGKVFSPQYVDWLVPLVPAAGPVAAAGTLAVLGLTHVVFDRFHASGGPGGRPYQSALVWWALARNLVVVALYGWLVVRLARRPNSRIP